MNIFYTSPDPSVCVFSLDDKRIVKMCLETAQMLSTAVHLQYVHELPKSSDVKFLYKPTHPYHPCNVWVRESPHNFAWLTIHLQGLLQEYSNRYLKVHDARMIYHICRDTTLANNWHWRDSTIPPNCARNSSLGIDCTSFSPSIIECYREYLRQRWATDKRAPKWTTPAKQPEWR